MKCPGLHCPGCGDGDGVIVCLFCGLAAVAAAGLAEWVFARVWWILGATAVAFAIAVHIVWRLFRWAERRDARHAAERPFLITREAPAATAMVTPQVTRTTPPAIVNNYYIRIDPASREAAAIIRTALPGKTGDAITEGKWQACAGGAGQDLTDAGRPASPRPRSGTPPPRPTPGGWRHTGRPRPGARSWPPCSPPG